MPVVRIVTNAIFCQIDGLLRLAGAIGRFGREKIRAELIGNGQMGIERSGDLEKWREQIVMLGAVKMLSAKILDHPRPVDVGHQSVITEAQPHEGLGRREVKDLVQGSAGAYAVNLAQRDQ